MSHTVLVTGAAGFIGSHLVDGLLASGASVRALDNFSTGRRENLSFVDALPAATRARYTLIEGDIRDAALIAGAVRGVDGVLHHAALPSVARSVADPLEAHDVNVTGTVRLLWAAHAAGARRVVIASSSAVYGEGEGLPKREDMPLDLQSPYAVTKAVCETYAHTFARLYGLETVCLRYFNVYGPRQNPHSDYAAVVPAFITRLLAGQAPTVYGDGQQSRDFTYVSDVVAANLAALRVAGLAGRVMNIGCGTRYTLNELLHALGPIAGATPPRFEPPRPGDVRDSQADIARARTLMGFAPAVDLDDGLRRTTESLRASPARVP
jgi:UDP-N-acetylglucosamine/UDP-N-acetyl-alpha-D-glucosaminouronate 4-epimerase